MYLRMGSVLMVPGFDLEMTKAGVEDLFFYPGCFPGGRLTGPWPYDF